MKTLFTILIFLTSFLSQAQITFEKVYSDSGITTAYDITATFDGGYAVTGFKTCSSFGCLDFFLLKLDSLGNKEWVRLYEAGFNADDFGYSIKQTSDSGYVMAGYASTAPNLAHNVRLLKTDKDGNKLWDRNYGGLGCQRGYDVEETYDKGLIIATQQDTGGNCFEIQIELIKTDSNGLIEFQKQYHHAGDGRAKAVKQTSDSGYVVTGVTNDMVSPISGEDIFLLKTDKNGDTVWTKYYDNGSERGEDVIIASDGGYVIAGYTNGITSLVGAYVIKTDNMGDTLWTNIYEKENQNNSLSLIEDSQGNYILAGSSATASANNDFYMLKINYVGDKIWERGFEYQANSDELGYSLTLAHDEGYVMCGSTTSPSLSQVYVVKTDTAGLITGINDIVYQPKLTFNVYPNPFNSYTTVDLSEVYNYDEDIMIELYDFTGKLLFQQKVTESKTKLYNQGFAKGMYLLTIKIYPRENGELNQLIATKKLIIN